MDASSLTPRGTPSPAQLINKSGFSISAERQLSDEILAMRRVAGHRNVLECLDVYETSMHVYLVLELATEGSLLDHILAKIEGGEVFSESFAASVIRQVADGIHHCHRLGVVHR